MKSILLVVLLSIMSSWTSTHACGSPQQESRDFLVALERAIIVWRDAVEFKGTFEFSSTTVENVDKVFERGFFEDKGLKNELSAKGVIAKRDGVFRIKFDSEFSDFDEKTNSSSFLSFDAFTNGEYEFVYYPRQHAKSGEQLGHTATFIENPFPESFATQGYFQTTNPFALSGAINGSLFHQADLNNDSFHVERKSDDELVVVFDGSSPDAFRRYTVSLTSALPTLRQIETKDSKIVLRDFADMGNGCLMARECIDLIGPMRLPGYSKPVWTVRRFISKDLGKTTPTSAEVVAVLPEGVVLQGLDTENLVVDLNDIRHDDIVSTSRSVHELEVMDDSYHVRNAPLGKDEKNRPYTWWIALVGSLLVFGFAVRIFREKSSGE